MATTSAVTAGNGPTATGKAAATSRRTGKVWGRPFRSGEARVNPDTLERDHATLIVNRKDDAFAKKRFGDDGKQAGDEPKCKRNGSLSSTTRLFPVRPPPDIDR